VQASSLNLARRCALITTELAPEHRQHFAIGIPRLALEAKTQALRQPDRRPVMGHGDCQQGRQAPSTAPTRARALPDSLE